MRTQNNTIVKNVDFFRALGDPIRLEMVMRLSAGEPHTLTTLTSGFAITRQGARKHIQVLSDSEIVHLKQKGRETQILLNHEALEKGQTFLAEIEKQWDQRLSALKDFVEK